MKKKLLLGILASSFCFLSAMEPEKDEKNGLILTNNKMIANDGTKWTFDFEHSNATRKVPIEGGMYQMTKFDIIKDKSKEPTLELPLNPVHDEWYPFYEIGTLSLKSVNTAKAEKIDLPFTKLFAQLKVVRAKEKNENRRHYFENEFSKEQKGFKTVKRYPEFECVCAYWHDEVILLKDGTEKAISVSASQVTHKIGGKVSDGVTNPESQPGGPTLLPNRGSGTGTSNILDLLKNTGKTAMNHYFNS